MAAKFDIEGRIITEATALNPNSKRPAYRVLVESIGWATDMEHVHISIHTNSRIQTEKMIGLKVGQSARFKGAIRPEGQWAGRIGGNRVFEFWAESIEAL